MTRTAAYSIYLYIYAACAVLFSSCIESDYTAPPPLVSDLSALAEALIMRDTCEKKSEALASWTASSLETASRHAADFYQSYNPSDPASFTAMSSLIIAAGKVEVSLSGCAEESAEIAQNLQKLNDAARVAIK